MSDEKPKRSKRQPKGEYEVGYAKPPAEHQFRKGEKRPATRKGRGSTKPTNSLVKLLKTPVPTTDSGRRKRVTPEEAINRNLIQRALKGDPKAVSEIMKFLAVMAKIEADRAPTEEELRAKMEEDRVKAEANKKHSDMIIDILNKFASWKRMGIFDDKTGQFAHWIHQEVARRRHGNPEYAARHYIQYIPYVPVGMNWSEKDAALFYASEPHKDKCNSCGLPRSFER